MKKVITGWIIKKKNEDFFNFLEWKLVFKRKKRAKEDCDCEEKPVKVKITVEEA